MYGAWYRGTPATPPVGFTDTLSHYYYPPTLMKIFIQSTFSLQNILKSRGVCRRGVRGSTFSPLFVKFFIFKGTFWEIESGKLKKISIECDVLTPKSPPWMRLYPGA